MYDDDKGNREDWYLDDEHEGNGFFGIAVGLLLTALVVVVGYFIWKLA